MHPFFGGDQDPCAAKLEYNNQNQSDLLVRGSVHTSERPVVRSQYVSASWRHSVVCNPYNEL
jgi:hypothetical protein